MKLAGTVVLYNPDNNLIENINTYLPFLEKLYVMDNSTQELDVISKVKELDKVNYISLGGNKGIAQALRIATETAIEGGFDFLLTMDQDSKFPTEDFEYIKDYIDNCDTSNVGLFAVNYDGCPILIKSEDKKYVEKINTCITSGTFMVLENYKKIDGFNDDLFIDLVDYDICCQYHEKDIDMLMFVNIKLNHKLGKEQVLNFLIFKKKRVIHSGLRYYYKYRNWHYLKRNRSKKYFDNLKELKKRFKFDRVIGRIIFQRPHLEIAKYIFRGIKDGKKGILGPYQEKKKKIKNNTK